MQKWWGDQRDSAGGGNSCHLGPVEVQAKIEIMSQKEQMSTTEMQLSQIDKNMAHLFLLVDHVANLVLSQEHP